MPFIQLFDEDAATGDLAEFYQQCRSRAGYVANILKLQSQNLSVLKAGVQFYIQLMKSPNALSAGRREMLATVVSNVNNCFY